jgi:hypothetical protein
MKIETGKEGKGGTYGVKRVASKYPISSSPCLSLSFICLCSLVRDPPRVVLELLENI